MHIIKITDESLTSGQHQYYCPYCKSYLHSAVKDAITHNCSDAGYTIIINGFMVIGAPNYLEEERNHENSQ